jgi:hypothetical protein
VPLKNNGSTNIQKNSAAIAQNGDFYCKNWSFALLLFTNPLFYTIINNISMAVVAIGGLFPLPLQHHNGKSPWSF